VTGLVWQIYVRSKIPYFRTEGQSVEEKLVDYIGFYYKYYMSSIYVGAFSATLLFLIGSMIYLLGKYQEIPQFHTDDYIVMSTGVLLSYGLSFIVQLKYSNFRIKQLEKSLYEIEENSINESSIKEHFINRKIISLIFGIALIVGLILFLFLLCKYA